MFINLNCIFTYIVQDKLKSMKQGGGKEGGRKRPRRSGWEEDDDYVEEERDIEYGSWNRNIYHASILIKHIEHMADSHSFE